MKTKITFLSILFFIFFNSHFHAQVGFNVGTEYGIGAIAQAGSSKIKFEVGGGVTPILIFWQITGADAENYIKLYISGTVGAKLNIAINNDEEHRLGFKFGANYDTIIKAGFGAGIDYIISERFVFSGGAMYYPEAYRILLDRLNDEENTNYTEDQLSSFLVGFRPFVSLSIYL